MSLPYDLTDLTSGFKKKSQKRFFSVWLSLDEQIGLPGGILPLWILGRKYIWGVLGFINLRASRNARSVYSEYIRININ